MRNNFLYFFLVHFFELLFALIIYDELLFVNAF